MYSVSTDTGEVHSSQNLNMVYTTFRPTAPCPWNHLSSALPTQRSNFGEVGNGPQSYLSAIPQQPLGPPPLGFPFGEDNNIPYPDLSLAGRAFGHVSAATVPSAFPHHTSRVRPGQHGLEFYSSPAIPTSQGSRRPLLPATTLHEGPFAPYGCADELPALERDPQIDFLDGFDSTPSNIGLPIVSEGPFGRPSSHCPAAGSPSVPRSLGGVHEVKSDRVAQEVSSGSGATAEQCLNNDSDPKAMLWKYYHETFKPSQLPPQESEQWFKEEVGSIRTVQASLRKRKDEGQWACPLDGETFTRKQNLKHHIQSHLGIRDHECNCGSTFTALSGLKRHQRKCH